MGFLEQARQAGMQISPQGAQAIAARLDGLLGAMEQVDTNNARALRKDVTEYLQTTGLVPSEEEAEAQQAMEIAQQTGGGAPPPQVPVEEAM